MKKITLLLIACALLSSCASRRQPNNTDRTIADAASSVSNNLTNLAAIEQAAHPQNKPLPPPDPSTYGMAMPATVHWTGPIEPLLKQIADQTGYQLRVLGTAPAIPVYVTIHSKGGSVADIIRSANAQAGKREKALIFPTRKIIQLTYLQD